ncbi:MAG: serine/threonine protein kinase [Gammaproteobacteria bacterium]|nr:serine/threonine protein kinase [Gammaproteobacteria bacterium]
MSTDSRDHDLSGHPYDALTPDVILDSVEVALSVRCTGALQPLNSYENRVYRVDIEDQAPVAVKFYRPGRWSDATILEEHAFALELAGHEVPVVAPTIVDGQTLLRHQVANGEFRFAVFPWAPGRRPELNSRDDRVRLGRYLGRLHNIGASARFRHRLALGIDNYGRDSVRFLLDNPFVPDYLRTSYEQISKLVIEHCDILFQRHRPQSLIRLHGDFHLSNVLSWEGNVYLVDLDDTLTGPAIQDLWMLLEGSETDMAEQLEQLLEGYETFRAFDRNEIGLIEALRSLRLLHYSAWLARRWHDPAFPHNFPWFDTPRYWEEQIQTLQEQLAKLQQPPLQLQGSYNFDAW